jgi:hypothetical protein
MWAFSMFGGSSPLRLPQVDQIDKGLSASHDTFSFIVSDRIYAMRHQACAQMRRKTAEASPFAMISGTAAGLSTLGGLHYTQSGTRV